MDDTVLLPSNLRRLCEEFEQDFPDLLSQTLDLEPLLYPQYRGKPLEFVREVLRQKLTPDQEQILSCLEVAPYRVLAKAGHNVGKTMAAACAVLYWHLTRAPCIIVTTAPKKEQVRDLLWKEIRRLAPSAVRFAGAKACRIDRGAANDFVVGTTAQGGTEFQGQHEESMLFVFDEAVGVDDEFWEAAETMFGGKGHAWLCLFNPTDTASKAYREEHADRPQEEGWHVVTLSCLSHPNILRALDGQDPQIPAAVQLPRLSRMLADWSDRIDPKDAGPLDVEWPPGSNTFYRPGPIAECRLLGRWPSQSFYSVWGDRLWQAAIEARLTYDRSDMPVFGCDVARFGDDYTEIHGRRGFCSIHHEAHNGWDGVQVAARLKELARESCVEWVGQEYISGEPAWRETIAKRVRLVVDDTGGIGGVYEILARDGWNVTPINANSNAMMDLEYSDIRSELWFIVRDLAKAGKLDLHRLSKDSLATLRTQAMAQTWKVDAAGRRKCLPKDEIKDTLKRSPDSMDAMNLAYYPVNASIPTVHQPQAKPSVMNRDRGRARSRLGL